MQKYLGLFIALWVFLLGTVDLTAITINHESRLTLLKNKGFQPRVIYDIGAFHGTWSVEIKKVFNQAQFYLFEANEAHRPFLEKLSFPFFIGALGDREESVSFYSNNSTGDSLFKEKTRFYQEGTYHLKKVAMSTLEKVVSKNKLLLPDLIKIDVQGAEKLIIQGSPSIIQHAEVVILETKILEYNEGAPLIGDIILEMKKLGFRMLDILELHYLPTEELNEIDFLFVRDNSPLIKKGMLI